MNRPIFNVTSSTIDISIMTCRPAKDQDVVPTA